MGNSFSKIIYLLIAFIGFIFAVIFLFPIFGFAFTSDITEDFLNSTINSSIESLTLTNVIFIVLTMLITLVLRNTSKKTILSTAIITLIFLSVIHMFMFSLGNLGDGSESYAFVIYTFLSTPFYYMLPFVYLLICIWSTVSLRRNVDLLNSPSQSEKLWLVYLPLIWFVIFIVINVPSVITGKEERARIDIKK